MIDNHAREAMRGGYLLADLEAEMLHDDADARHLLTKLQQCLEALAAEQAMAVQIRDESDADDTSRARQDYHDARGRALAAAEATYPITQEGERP